MSKFILPSINFHGIGCLEEAVEALTGYQFKKALIVTDEPLVAAGVVGKVTEQLDAINLSYVIYDGTRPDPTTANVEAGKALLLDSGCDVIISVGGGSPQDCAKAIAIVAGNGGHITEYEGIGKVTKPIMPLIAINTTSGTASEMTQFAVITDEKRVVKMAIVDPRITPTMSVNEPKLTIGLPKALTAATGMDALTHAIEAFVSSAANPLTDVFALEAISLITKHLPTAVENGANLQARENMMNAAYLAGMAFNNALLGYVHAMAHQVGAKYHIAHGVCNAVLLPHVQRFNAQACPERLGMVAKAMGVTDSDAQSPMQQANMAIAAICALSERVGIPKGLASLGVKEADLPQLASQALEDVCGLSNPIQATKEQIIEIYRAAL